jgi:hypothetical protein
MAHVAKIKEDSRTNGRKESGSQLVIEFILENKNIVLKNKQST